MPPEFDLHTVTIRCKKRPEGGQFTASGRIVKFPTGGSEASTLRSGGIQLRGLRSKAAGDQR
jgi:hypothetical protein